MFDTCIQELNKFVGFILSRSRFRPQSKDTHMAQIGNKQIMTIFLDVCLFALAPEINPVTFPGYAPNRWDWFQQLWKRKTNWRLAKIKGRTGGGKD